MKVKPLIVIPSDQNREQVIRKGQKLQYWTITWNSLECVIAVVAGFLAGSIALVGFGFDSAIEVTSSLAALWRLRQDRDEQARAVAERRASQVIGACFLLLAVYVLYEALDSIIEQLPPDHSLIGIALAALSLIVMPRTDAHFTFKRDDQGNVMGVVFRVGDAERTLSKIK